MEMIVHFRVNGINKVKSKELCLSTLCVEHSTNKGSKLTLKRYAGINVEAKYVRARSTFLGLIFSIVQWE